MCLQERFGIYCKGLFYVLTDSNAGEIWEEHINP